MMRTDDYKGVSVKKKKNYSEYKIEVCVYFHILFALGGT